MANDKLLIVVEIVEMAAIMILAYYLYLLYKETILTEKEAT